MRHLGDITQIKGYEAPTVDCIIGGSPCQDLSVAGKRAGLAGDRSGLFMEQIRVIKEMRERDRANGRTGVDVRCRYGIWENVPGALSSPGKGHAGEDFAAVIEEFVRVAEPQAPSVCVPEKGWPTAGCYYDEMGNWSIAWRIMDSQFWGVPQRRRRICLVADFNGLNAPKIVFGEVEHHRSTKRVGGDPSIGDLGDESRSEVQPVTEGLSGYPDKSEPPMQESAGDAGESSGGTGCGAFGCDTYNYTVTGDVACTLNSNSCITSSRVGPTVAQPVFSVDQGGGKSSACSYEDVSPTLTCTHDGAPAVVYGISPYHSNCMKSDNPNSGYYEADTARSLDAMNCGYPACNQGGMAVVQPVVDQHILDDQGGSQISVRDDGKCPTLRAETHGNLPCVMETVAYDNTLCIEMTSTKNTIIEDGICPTLTARMGTGGNQVNAVLEPVGYEMQAFGKYKDSGMASSLKARDYKDATDLVVAGVDCRNATEIPEQNITLQSSCSHNLNSGNVVRVKHIVRRLTPLECERLQGFPDCWTDIGEWIDTKGKKHKEADSPRYKALGNSIALPPWKWVLKRLCACYERDATMASLFDGIGGFPLIWEQLNGKGSCLWASEIEEFPIAVTKLRFGGNNDESNA